MVRFVDKLFSTEDTESTVIPCVPCVILEVAGQPYVPQTEQAATRPLGLHATATGPANRLGCKCIQNPQHAAPSGQRFHDLERHWA